MKLREIYEYVVDLVENGKAHEVGSFIETLGGNYLHEGAFSRAYVVPLPWGKVVIKYAENSYDEGVNVLTRYDGKKWPLLWRRYVKPLFSSSSLVVVQPYVETVRHTSDIVRLERAARIFRKWLDKLYFNDFDAHNGNVGFYRGRLVIFDPLTPEVREVMEGGRYRSSYEGSY